MTSRYTCNSSSLSPNYSRRLSMLYPGGLSISYGHGLSTEHDTRISRLQGQNGVTRFDYLGLDNIVKRKNVNKEWSLDALGNWNSVSDESQNRTHNAQNQLTSVEGNTLTYDANGNMKTDETGQTLVYDAWNRLVSVTPPGGSATTYAYDARAGGRMHQTAESPRLATARPPAGMSRGRRTTLRGRSNSA